MGKYTKEMENMFKDARNEAERDGESEESLRIFDTQKEIYAELLMGTKISYATVDFFWKDICKDRVLDENLLDAKLAYDNTAKFLYDKKLIKGITKDYEDLNAMQVHMKIMKLYYSLGVDGELGRYVISEDSISEFYRFVELCKKHLKK